MSPLIDGIVTGAILALATYVLVYVGVFVITLCRVASGSYDLDLEGGCDGFSLEMLDELAELSLEIGTLDAASSSSEADAEEDEDEDEDAEQKSKARQEQNEELATRGDFLLIPENFSSPPSNNKKAHQARHRRIRTRAEARKQQDEQGTDKV